MRQAGGRDHLRHRERPGHARRDPRDRDRHRVRQAGRGGGDRLARRARRTAVPRARHAAHARPARGVREAGGAAGPALRAAAPFGVERPGDPNVHRAEDGLMAWRTSHFVAAGALVAGGLAWASRDAWPWRRPLTAPAIVVDAAYADLTTALGRRETLAEVLARGGIRGRDYAAFLAAAQSLPVRRLRPGLKFDLRRLKTDSIARRVTVRSEEHTSELQSQSNLVCRLLLEQTAYPETITRVDSGA